jgi:hypothetical protein
MALSTGRHTGSHNGTWFEEQATLINSVSESELSTLGDKFDEKFETVANTLARQYGGLNIMRDAQRMLQNDAIMESYKEEMLEPILQEIREYPVNSDAERIHMEQVADQLSEAWDQSKKSFIQESYNVANYLPLSTLDFPALVKQYIRFLGKDIIPVQTANSVNVEQRIIQKYLVNNQTGEEYEVPAVYWMNDEDPNSPTYGQPLWRKLWNAGKGIKIYDKAPITTDLIKSAPNKKFSMFDWLTDDETGEKTSITPNVRTRLSYDFNIQYVQVAATEASTKYNLLAAKPADWDTATGTSTKYFTKSGDTYTAVNFTDTAGTVAFAENTYYEKVTVPAQPAKKIKLPGAGIQIDIQTGGVFLNGGITENMRLPVVNEKNIPTGEVVTGISDMLSGRVDFVKGTLTFTTCGPIDGVYVTGRISNETNMRTIGFREYPEIRKFLIADGCRFQLPFTVEDFTEANSSLNFNLYNRLVQEIVTNQEMFEDQSILEYLDEQFELYNGYDSDVWSLESYTHTEYADLDPTSISPNFAGDPWEYRTNAIHNAINTVIYELCDRGKLENLGFVIYANPKACRLLDKFVTWTVQKTTTIGGVQMNHAFGLLTDSSIPIRVVASNRVDAYTVIDAYQPDAAEKGATQSREYFFKIVAYPMDKFHISYKHLRFARHLTNSPENAAYADAQNPGGAAVMVTTSAQYQTISVQGIQGRVICKNTVLVPDIKAGLIVPTALTEGDDDSQGTGGGD